MGRKIGYARCSTAHQSTDSQVDDLRAAGCEEVFFEKVSSTTTLDKRLQLRACLSMLRAGDQLVVAKLDRLGRSQVEVINRLNDLQQQGIHVKTLDGLIDTQALGKMAPLVVGLLTGLSEVERSLIQERTRESVEHRRKTGGNLGGRPKTNAKKESLVLRLHKEGESYRSIREQTGLALATITRIVKEQQVAC
ncbi:MAG: recombinase family protein [Cyanobacteria bacterium K_Offshore_surface_m2_011]|nr:recombinase family protein [Cyanobacteria bacterium K_Offshore_surface_m2_011]